RAKEAERKARAAESAAASSIHPPEDTGAAPLRPPEPPPPPATPPAPPPPVPGPPTTDRPAPPTGEPGPPTAKADQEDDESGAGILGRTVGAILGVGPGREGDEVAGSAPQESEAENPLTREPPEWTSGGAGVGADSGDRVNLNEATFEELRDVGFSVTQATRVITYRERENGFKSLDDLANVPGM